MVFKKLDEWFLTVVFTLNILYIFLVTSLIGEEVAHIVVIVSSILVLFLASIFKRVLWSRFPIRTVLERLTRTFFKVQRELALMCLVCGIVAITLAIPNFGVVGTSETSRYTLMINTRIISHLSNATLTIGIALALARNQIRTMYNSRFPVSAFVFLGIIFSVTARVVFLLDRSYIINMIIYLAIMAVQQPRRLCHGYKVNKTHLIASVLIISALGTMLFISITHRGAFGVVSDMVSTSAGYLNNIEVGVEHPYAFLGHLTPFSLLGLPSVSERLASYQDLPDGGSIGSNSILYINGLLQSRAGGIIPLIAYSGIIGLFLSIAVKAIETNSIWWSVMVVGGGTLLKFWRQEILGSINTVFLCIFYLYLSVCIGSIIKQTRNNVGG